MSLEDLLEDRFIQLTIYLQLSRLQREQLSSLTYQHLEDTLKGLIWKKQVPPTLHEAVDEAESRGNRRLSHQTGDRAVQDCRPG